MPHEPSELFASPSNEASRVQVPDVEFSDPASVAEAFYVAWLSYDAAVDTLDSRRARVQPYTTPALLEQGAFGNRLPAAEWQRAQNADEVVQVVAPHAFVEPYAPSPTPTRAHYMVVGTLRTTTQEGTHEEPAPPYPLVLESVAGRWLVVRISYH